jgi:hypothetical protein
MSRLEIEDDRIASTVSDSDSHGIVSALAYSETCWGCCTKKRRRSASFNLCETCSNVSIRCTNCMADASDHFVTCKICDTRVGWCKYCTIHVHTNSFKCRNNHTGSNNMIVNVVRVSKKQRDVNKCWICDKHANKSSSASYYSCAVEACKMISHVECATRVFGGAFSTVEHLRNLYCPDHYPYSCSYCDSTENLNEQCNLCAEEPYPRYICCSCWGDGKVICFDCDTGESIEDDSDISDSRDDDSGSFIVSDGSTSIMSEDCSSLSSEDCSSLSSEDCSSLSSEESSCSDDDCEST